MRRRRRRRRQSTMARAIKQRRTTKHGPPIAASHHVGKGRWGSQLCPGGAKGGGGTDGVLMLRGTSSAHPIAEVHACMAHGSTEGGGEPASARDASAARAEKRARRVFSQNLVD